MSLYHYYKRAFFFVIFLFFFSIKLGYAEGVNYIFGYGSLMNTESRAMTSGEGSQDMKVIPVRVSADFGYVRSWNFRSPSGFTALGVRAVERANAMTINGVIYKANGAMAKFDQREAGYTRVEIPYHQITFLNLAEVSEKDKFWIYVPNSDTIKVPDRNFPLLQSYIDVCIIGALEYNSAFAKEFINTTEGWSQYWLNDRLLARRPWVKQKKYKVVDKILGGYTALRKFSEDYASYYPAN